MPLKQKSIPKKGISEESTYFHEFKLFSKKVRNNILELRKKKNMTQEQMQDYELNLRQFQRIESGETENITLSSLFRIAKAFQITPAELIDVIKKS